MTHYNLLHKFIPMPPSDENSGCRSSSGQEMEEARNIPSVANKEEVILEAQRDKKKVHFAALMNICHIKSAESDPKLQKCHRQNRDPW